MFIEWRRVNGFPKYEVSNTGLIMSFHYNNPRLLKPETDKDGYKRVLLCNKGERKKWSVHQLVLSAFVQGTSPGDYVSRHLNDNPADNDISNLAWGTPLENAHDRDAHGRTCCGSRHHLSKLKEEDIFLIREMIRQGKKDEEISLCYGVVPATIWFV